MVLLTSCGLRPQKAHLPSIHFLSVPLVCRKSFPVGCAQDTGNSPLVGSDFNHVRNFRNVWHHQSPLPRHLYVYHTQRGDPLYIAFRYYKKVLNVWIRAAHAPIGVKLNPEVYPCHNRFLPNFIQIGGYLEKWRPKNLFSGHNRARPCQCMGMAVNDNEMTKMMITMMIDQWQIGQWEQRWSTSGRTHGVLVGQLAKRRTDVTQQTDDVATHRSSPCKVALHAVFWRKALQLGMCGIDFLISVRFQFGSWKKLGFGSDSYLLLM